HSKVAKICDFQGHRLGTRFSSISGHLPSHVSLLYLLTNVKSCLLLYSPYSCWIFPMRRRRFVDQVSEFEKNLFSALDNVVQRNRPLTCKELGVGRASTLTSTLTCFDLAPKLITKVKAPLSGVQLHLCPYVC